MSRLTSGALRCVLVAFVATALLPGSASAQAVTGTISGTVVDPQARVVPGATVTVTNEATTDTRVVVSDAEGNFLVTNLQPGSYTLKISLQGFRTLDRTNIVLSAAERLAVANLSLEVGSVRETVIVDPAPPPTTTPPTHTTRPL